MKSGYDLSRSSLHPGTSDPDSVFSILIPTWNNLDFVRLCVRSIRQHSARPHQIILHINDGSDGTLDWARSEGLGFTHSPENIGICLAVNLARTLARTDYLVYMNDDMYVCPGWDAALIDEIQKLGHHLFFLSSTMIEPFPTKSTPVIASRNYGTSLDTFDEARLLAEFDQPDRPDWSGASRPPNVMHKSVWDMVGGFSAEFSPGGYSDPDLSMKLWFAGVRHFRGVGRSRVYHFASKSTGRMPMNRGRTQFLKKWGLSSGAFETHLLRLGQPFTGDLTEPTHAAFRREVWRSRLKARFVS